MLTISSTPVLYVYRCNACGHAGELWLLEQQEKSHRPALPAVLRSPPNGTVVLS